MQVDVSNVIVFFIMSCKTLKSESYANLGNSTNPMRKVLGLDFLSNSGSAYCDYLVAQCLDNPQNFKESVPFIMVPRLERLQLWKLKVFEYLGAVHK